MKYFSVISRNFRRFPFKNSKNFAKFRNFPKNCLKFPNFAKFPQFPKISLSFPKIHKISLNVNLSVKKIGKFKNYFFPGN